MLKTPIKIKSCYCCMKSYKHTLVKLLTCLVATLQISCTQHTSSIPPVIAPSQILKDLNSFLAYREAHIRLYEDFIPFDSLQNRVSKKTFLQQYATGKYLALRLKLENDSLAYQLYKFNPADNVDILVSNKYWAEHENHFYSMEGKELPDYNFEDVRNNTTFTKSDTKGKILVLKCWFINCAPCVKEIPKCNEIEARYHNRKDVLFLAVSWDTKKELLDFLKKNSFTYVVIPGQKAFLQDSLALSGYPTHFVIGKDGKILKMNFDFNAMEYALNKAIQ